MSDEKKTQQDGNKNYRRNSSDSNDQSRMNKRRMYSRRKVCRFCANKTLNIDYKEFETLRRFTTEGGKIIPRRISGNCAKHQRQLAGEIKKARAIALLPFVKN